MDRQTVILQHFQEAERHVDESAARISKYERMVAELERDGHDATMTKELLNTLRKSQVLLERSLEFIRDDLAKLV